MRYNNITETQVEVDDNIYLINEAGEVNTLEDWNGMYHNYDLQQVARDENGFWVYVY